MRQKTVFLAWNFIAMGNQMKYIRLSAAFSSANQQCVKCDAFKRVLDRMVERRVKPAFECAVELRHSVGGCGRGFFRQRQLDGMQDVICCDLTRAARKSVAALTPLDGVYKLRPLQQRKDLFEIDFRNAEALCNTDDRHGSACVVFMGKIGHCGQPVTAFCRNFHGSTRFLYDGMKICFFRKLFS